MTINDWVEKCHKIAREHGWWDEDESIGQKIALMHAELSEALEQARDGRPGVWYECAKSGLACCEPNCDCSRGGTCATDDKKAKPEGIYVELVDCVIRIFDYLGHEGADVEAIMAEKCAYNETRPYRHGKKF